MVALARQAEGVAKCGVPSFPCPSVPGRSRHVYDPYGNVTIYDDDWSETRETSSYDNNILYCGYYHDSETGLYHVRRRYLHSTLGRWLSRDPIGYEDGMGLYEYVGGSPVEFVDPYGLHPYGLQHGLVTGMEAGAAAGTMHAEEHAANSDATGGPMDTAKGIAAEGAETAAKEVSKNLAETGKFDLNPDVGAETVSGALKGMVTQEGAKMVDAMEGGLRGFANSKDCRDWYVETYQALENARDPSYQECNPCRNIARGLGTGPIAGHSGTKAGGCYWAVMAEAGSGAAAVAVAEAFMKYARHLSRACYKMYDQTHP